MNMKINLEKLKNCKNKKQLTRRLLRNLKSQNINPDNIDEMYIFKKSSLQNNNMSSNNNNNTYKIGHYIGGDTYTGDSNNPYKITMSNHTSSNNSSNSTSSNSTPFYFTKLNVVISDMNYDTVKSSDHNINHKTVDFPNEDFVSTDKTTGTTLISVDDWFVYFN